MPPVKGGAEAQSVGACGTESSRGWLFFATLGPRRLPRHPVAFRTARGAKGSYSPLHLVLCSTHCRLLKIRPKIHLI